MTDTVSPDRIDAADAPAPDALDATHSPEVLAAVHDLVPLLYEELHRTARRERRRFSVGDTLATTVLVNEVYMRLASSPGFGTRSHFLAVAAIAMRRILIEAIRAQMRVKRGGEFQRVGFEHALDVEIDNDEKILAINDALLALAERSPRLAQIVECRFFAGYSEKETAQALDVSERTVQRDWATARAWLQRQVEQAI
ncbi:MAG TPA: ECF-type sigma factor [Thermomonas sp.]|nr:ECF-type sigma factor [Thermomonas sp.]